MTKKCSHCGREKESTKFNHDNDRPDKLACACRHCNAAIATASMIRRTAYFKLHPITEKKCCYCKVTKTVKEFYKNVSVADGYKNYCKLCVLLVHKKRSHLTTWWYRRCFGGGRGIPTNDVTPFEVKQMYDANPCCTYCGVSLQGVNIYNAHVDHKIPKKRGGTDKIENLCIACKECNRMKHAMTDTEFRAFLLEYVARFDAPIAQQSKVFSLSDYAKKELNK